MSVKIAEAHLQDGEKKQALEAISWISSLSEERITMTVKISEAHLQDGDKNAARETISTISSLSKQRKAFEERLKAN
jgi:hypothetical protein